MIIHYDSKKIKVPVRKVSALGELTGLMFKKKNTENLLFSFDKETQINIHSFFVFFNFLAIWLNDKNKIIDFKIIKPFTIAVKPKKPFRKLIELPINAKNKKILRFFVDKGKV
jgi:uncharacterized membrane protein (UPF0127 family)|tara:strand:+ start:636 stop:974 length:339 start_codon:yes stop_codon:yes gene_type:complete